MMRASSSRAWAWCRRWLRRRGDLEAHSRRARAARAGSTSFEVSDDLPARSPARIPRGDGSDGTFNPDQWMEPKEQRKVDDFIIYRHGRRQAGAADSGWKPKTEEDQLRHRRADRLRHRRPRRHRRAGLDPAGKGPAPHVALLHSRPPDQSRLRLCLDRARLKGPNHAVVTACSTGAHAIGDAAGSSRSAMPM
jgi:3-oxoacyl-[acyl-carrier-protein] synthase II